MSIYNKKLLGVILIVMIIASVGFYYLNREEQVDKDQLYENKLASQDSNDNAKNHMACRQTMKSQDKSATKSLKTAVTQPMPLTVWLTH